MDADELMSVLEATARSVHDALAGLSDWGLAHTRPGQYRSDLVADTAALSVLQGAGLAVLSEESGHHEGTTGLLAVLDPVDGSTNASRGLPWYATSICVLDDEGPLAALVVNQAVGTRYEAVRGKGARRDGVSIAPSNKEALAESIVALSGFPRAHLGWRQYRALGAAALDMCAVADGRLDAYLDCVDASHGPWDYLGGLLVCSEAGAFVAETAGRDLLVTGHHDRRSPAAAGTRQLLEELLDVFDRHRDQGAR